MQQAFYTSVNNAKIHEGKKGCHLKSDPVPLIKENFLGEFRSNIEKAKVRKNLGIADELNLQWGNISGTIENQSDLIKYIEDTKKYYSESHPQLETISKALDYIITFVEGFESEAVEIEHIKTTISNIHLLIREINDVDENQNDKIVEINQKISDLNEAIETIDVDENIKNWVTKNVDTSSSLYIDESLEVKLSQKEDNALIIKDDGLYAKDFYTPKVADEATVPNTIGGIQQGMTKEQLSTKTFTELFDLMLFPSVPEKLYPPVLNYNQVNKIVQVGTPAIVPILTFIQKDAGNELERIETIEYNNYNSSNLLTDVAVYDLGVYQYIGTVSYEAGHYANDNLGNITTNRIEAGSLTAQFSITATYPWYTANFNGEVTDVNEQPLIEFNRTVNNIEVSLTGRAVIMLPGANTELTSFQVDGGLGYLPVDMTGWEQTTLEKNNTIYKVWTKQDAYNSILKHKLSFILKK